MKRLFLSTAIILTAMLATSAYAQKKINLLVDYFYTPESVSQAHANLIRNVVMEGLHSSNRVNLIDVQTSSTLALEEDRRKVGVSAGDDMERLAIMTQEGADLLLQGVVNDISFSETTTTDSKGGTSTTYEAIINLTLKVIDPKTGKLVETETLKVPNGLLDLSGFTIVAHSTDEAVSSYAKLLPKKMKRFINAAFPVVGNVLEVGEVKGNEVKTLYIDLGDNFGAKPKQKFEVREVRQIGGKTSRKLIGEVEIKDVEGEDLSLCVVKKGGKEIDASIKAENKLIVTSKD